MAAIRANPTFRKLESGNLLFAKYTCPVREPAIDIWAEQDHLIHVLTGKKSWRTRSSTWTAEVGQTVFFKKGAYEIRQNFSEDFCVLLFFIPDDIVRETVRELATKPPRHPPSLTPEDMAIRVREDAGVSAFLASMAAYLASDEPPPPTLLRLNLKGLITALILGRGNPDLRDYLQSVGATQAPPLTAIMEANFSKNLSLAEFARLAHRSLSSFKREFHRCYGTTPGRWLQAKRLERAADLLVATSATVTEVMLECGFESSSHFSRTFKAHHGQTPSNLRESSTMTADSAIPSGFAGR